MHREYAPEEQKLRGISQALLGEELQDRLTAVQANHLELLRTTPPPRKQAEPDRFTDERDKRIHVALTALSPANEPAEAPEGSFANTLAQMRVTATYHVSGGIRTPLAARMYQSFLPEMTAAETKLRTAGQTPDAAAIAEAIALMTDFIRQAPPMPDEKEERRSARLETDARQRARKRKPAGLPPGDSESPAR
ncbi:MAG: hypothetical protein K2Q01_00450 [Rickettsiales bacterium]|nr:hypothetical protein [Rickettsiales bacterium]